MSSADRAQPEVGDRSTAWLNLSEAASKVISAETILRNQGAASLADECHALWTRIRAARPSDEQGGAA